MNHLKHQAARILAIAVALGFYFLARQPEISNAERHDTARAYSFQQTPLATAPTNAERRANRTVKPYLERIEAWISATGAGVALNDLDGDGLPNDICQVEPRTDDVIVAPAPTTGERFAPFALNAGNLFDRRTMAPMGCAPADLNEDGTIDLLVYYTGRTPLVFLGLRPDANKPFTPAAANYRVQETVTSPDQWMNSAATIADLDGDGHLDIAVGSFFADNADIFNEQARDNKLGMQHTMSRAFNSGRSRLLRWTGAGGGAQPWVRFEEVQDYLTGVSQTEKEQMTHAWVLALATQDLDGDLLPELFFCNDFGPDWLLYNRSTPGRFSFTPTRGRKGFTTPNSKAMGRDSFKGMGADFGDANNDGQPDIFVSNIGVAFGLEESHQLFINQGDAKNKLEKGQAPFYDESEAYGVSRSDWGWDAKFADFNNDGQLEIVQATGFIKGRTDRWPELHEVVLGNDQLLQNPANWPRLRTDAGDGINSPSRVVFFARAANGRFYDLAPELGLDAWLNIRGIATADVDGDGRMDFATGNQWEDSAFYRNQSQANNAFLGLRLRLPVGNRNQLTRPAIGATVTVQRPDGRSLTAQTDGGNGHSGKRSPDVHFGLGQLPPDTPLKVEIRWRDATGAIRSQNLTLAPGWHTVVLVPQGV
jgi:hypothetical protein